MTFARDRSVAFTPNDGVLVLRGVVGPDGTVHADFDPAGAGHHPFPLRFEGRLGESGVTGTYSSPLCRAHVELRSPVPVPRTLFSPGNLLGIGKP